VTLLVIAIVAVVALVLWAVPAIQREIAPQPVRAWVGIEVEGDGVARVGRIELAAEQSFRLHAILEATVRDGSSVYFTEAQAVELLPGVGQTTGEAQRFEGDAVRRYARPELARIIWLTLEGPAPFLPLQPGETNLDRLRFQEFSHPEWGRGWTARGSLEARHDDQLELDGPAEGLAFGTRHYRLWIDLLATEEAIVPELRLQSPGVADLVASPVTFSSVSATLPGSLATPSRVFGLTQVEPPPDASKELLAALAELQRHDLAFYQLLLLHQTIADAGSTIEELRWERLEWSLDSAWGDTVRPGDLVRVGARWVVLFRDDGELGVLDPADLCLDFDRGARVKRLDSVFATSGDLEWAKLAARP
jgi:hypothetical protein